MNTHLVTSQRQSRRVNRRAPLYGLGAALVFAAASIGEAASATQPGSLLSRMKNAYAELRTYEASIGYQMVQKQGRWTNRRATQMRVAFDRSNQRLFVKHPSYTLAVNDGTLRVKARGLNSRYLQLEAPSTLTHQWLSKQWPALDQPLVPELMLLLADEPMPPLSGWWLRDIEQKPDGIAGETDAPTIVLKTGAGDVRLILDPETHLVTRMVKIRQRDDSDVTLTRAYEMTIQQRNTTLAPSRFELETSGGQPVKSMAALSGRSQREDPLVGTAVPDVTFVDENGRSFKPGELEADVVVLDFWATWCLPCRQWMPQLNELHAWAQRNDKSLAIYAVTIDQQIAKARRYWKQQTFDYRYAEATDRAATRQAYGSSQRGMGAKSIPLPTTVVLHEGRIVQVDRGVRARALENLKQRIEALLAPDAQ